MNSAPFSFDDETVLQSKQHSVTSSILVRHFGLWSQRAAKAPLGILQHGRPRLILVSVDHWNALIARAAASEASSAIAAVEILDAISDMVIGVNAAGMITETSRVARAHFGGLVESGRPLESIAVGSQRAALQEVLERVLGSGTEATLHLLSAARAGRTIQWLIVPQRTGIALVGHTEAANTV